MFDQQPSPWACSVQRQRFEDSSHPSQPTGRMAQGSWRSFSLWALVSSAVLDRHEVLRAVAITVPGRWNGPTAASWPQGEGLLEQLL